MLSSLLDPTGPERPDALRIGDRFLSSAALARAAGAVAARLEGAEAVAVHATTSPETVVAVVAGLAAGVPVAPLPADAGPMEVGHILSDSGASLVLAPGGDIPAALASAGLPVEAVDLAAAGGGPPAPRPHRPGDPALILYTSGTTGMPKGVPVSRRAIDACIGALAGAWEWTPDDTTIHGLPFWHVHGLILGVLGPLGLGGRVVHTGRPTAPGYAAAVADVASAGGSAVVFGVPTVWSRVASDPAAAGAMRPARLLVSGSAALPLPVWERLAATAGQAPIERYGMTETLITLSARATGERRAGWVGFPLEGTETRILGDDGNPVPADGETLGDLEVRGPTVMDGYLRRPEATTAILRPDGWLRTGDVACSDALGWHRVVGRRATDLIKSGGYRIGAGEVEAALLGHPAVREAAVVGEPDEDLGQVVVAYVVAEGAGPGELAEHVAASLSAHKRPRRVVLVDSLPRNAMGKVQKGRLDSGR